MQLRVGQRVEYNAAGRDDLLPTWYSAQIIRLTPKKAQIEVFRTDGSPMMSSHQARKILTVTREKLRVPKTLFPRT